jgi:nitroimidazol reductase NimA-like FMN-containing flavoprotein (pyridoxamine 5'-phosphate oxidase superfamily)
MGPIDPQRVRPSHAQTSVVDTPERLRLETIAAVLDEGPFCHLACRRRQPYVIPTNYARRDRTQRPRLASEPDARPWLGGVPPP